MRSAAEAEANRRTTAATFEAEQRRVAMWKETPTRVASAFAMQTAASKLDKVGHLHITPDMLRGFLQELANGGGKQD